MGLAATLQTTTRAITTIRERTSGNSRQLCQGSARRGRQKVAILFGRFAKEIKGRVEKVANGQRRIKEGRASRRPGAGHTQQAAQGGAGACEARCGRARS